MTAIPSGARAVPGCDGYAVTSDGRVFTRRNGRSQELAQAVDRDGYPRVKLTRGERRAWTKVAKLVALAFLPPKPSPTHQIRHRDGDAANSDATNLAWGTPAENMADRERHGRTPRGEAHSGARLTTATVQEIRARCARGERQVDVAAALGTSQSTVTRVWRRVAWKHIDAPAQESP